MNSSAANVDAYLDEVPRERRQALERLRSLCQSELPGYEESMAYGMPSYSRDGMVEVAFASQKNNIALYVLREDALAAHRGAFAKSNVGKGCIRFRNPETIDFDVVEALLVATRESTGEVC